MLIYIKILDKKTLNISKRFFIKKNIFLHFSYLETRFKQLLFNYLSTAQVLGVELNAEKKLYHQSNN